jgi:hypothetical protein
MYTIPSPCPVFTTSDVVYQACDCNRATLHVCLPDVTERLIGKRIPAEVVDMIFDRMLGVSRKMAESLRRELMDDRRGVKDNEAEVGFSVFIPPHLGSRFVHRFGSVHTACAHNGAGYCRLSRSPNVGICPPQPGSFDGPKQGPSGLNMVWDIISDNIPPHTLSTASAGSAIMYCII